MAVAKLNASEKPEVRISGGMISARCGIIAPLYMPKNMDSHNSTISSRAVDGSLTSHNIAGYDVTIAAIVTNISIGRLPTLSEIAPPAGNQKKFDMPTQKVTIRLCRLVKCKNPMPSVAVYAGT